MSSGYIDFPIETDPDALARTALESLMASIPGWVPRDGHLEVWMIEVLARMVAEARDVASRVPRSIFRHFGRTLLGLPPVDAAPARVATTWTMIDGQGYTVPADTIAAFRVAGDTLVPFRVAEEFRVSPGQVATLSGQVILEAVDDGSHANGLTGPMVMVDALSYIASVVATEESSGGADAEGDDAYLDRLVAELELLSPRPILPDDFAVMARRTTGVHRALAIDGLDPNTGTLDNARMISVAVVDEGGNPLPGTVKDEVAAQLDARREVNFTVHVIDPTKTIVDVATTFTALPGYDLDALEIAVMDTVTSILDPGNWGGGDLTPPEWRPSANVVRYLEIASAIDRVPGVDYLASLTLNGIAGDVALPGFAPLPNPGTVTATVV